MTAHTQPVTGEIVPKEKQFVTWDERPAKSAAATPMEMLNMALERGATMDVLEKLMALQERWEANQSRKAFDAAIADAKAEISPVIRNAKGHNDKKYADFAAIAKAVDPIISKHGLSYRFRTVQSDRISVTCILSHKAGHSEETTLSGPPDQTGNKNAIQAIGSTLSYLQRYSLVQALGLATAHDDDGYAAGRADRKLVTEDQVLAIRDMLLATESDEAKFCQRLGVPTLAEICADKYDAACALIRQKQQRMAS
jgi:hypothetical protein